MSHHVAGKGHGEVVAEPLLAHLGCKLQRIALKQFIVANLIEAVARVENLEQQLVALLAILAHQRGEVLHSRGLNGLEAKGVEHLADSIEYIVALRHFGRREVARSLWYTGFCCHTFF